MCGGVRNIAARSACGVSPVRTAAVIRGAGQPDSSAETSNAAPWLREVLVDVRAQGFERGHVNDAHLVGRGATSASFTRSSSAVRNAARVLPDPVGAAMSVCRP